MRRHTAPLLIALALGATFSTAAQAAKDPGIPKAGAYAFSDVKGGLTINAAQTQLTGIHFSFTSGTADTVQCTEQGLPAGKIKATIAAPQKLVKAVRGGYTSYILGRSTPSTSNGVTAIPVKFKISPGGKATGTMYLVFQYDKPSVGGGEIVIDGCTLVIGIHKA